ncbi:3-oxoadipate enol-lactonase [Fodinicola feengrottensis]|uniref:3-oxoadipate enol-lactonase n=1 Tax=Fodinicola feengrottensis TaxID=435914 RepID=A0ABN2JDE9_9ACTN
MLIHHESDGSGPPVLLLHSGVADLRMWDPQWPELIAAHQVVRVDLRGFGKTLATAGTYRDADDVREVLDSLGISRTAMVGSSYGGRVAMEFAAAYPDRVTQLILLCPVYQGLPPTAALKDFAAAVAAFLEAGQLDAAVDLNVQTWLGPEADDPTRELVRKMQANSLRLKLVHPDGGPETSEIDAATIDIPALVVSGARDMDYFLAVAQHLAQVMPKARQVELAWAGHLPSLERPGEITQLLLEALL